MRKDTSINEENIALVTGSTKGLGLHIAKLLEVQGYRLILTGRSHKNLLSALQQMQHPNLHITFCGDLSQPDNVKKLCHLPFLPQVIIHNIGGKIEGDEQPLRPEILMQSLALNLGIAVSLNEYYLPLMHILKARHVFMKKVI